MGLCVGGWGEGGGGHVHTWMCFAMRASEVCRVSEGPELLLWRGLYVGTGGLTYL